MTMRESFWRRQSARMLAGLLVVSISVVSPDAAEAGSEERTVPNIIIIHVDDLGWMDLSCQGSDFFETPNLDRMAEQGIRFTQAYAAASICSPTRSALLTGRYPARIGITDWIRSRFQGGEIPPDGRPPQEYVGGAQFALLCPPNPLWMELEEVTLANLLGPAGFVSAHLGKWHLGTDDWYPEKQGFDYNFGGCDYGQPPSFFDPYTNARLPEGIPTLPARLEREYLTDREADEAVNFIRAYRDKSFFLHYAPYAVHTPIQAKPEMVTRYERKAAGRQSDPVYAAMVESVDHAVGRVLHTLAELKLEERTLVIFTSDNGGLNSGSGRPTNNHPLRSGKGFPYEGGLRVPLIMRWPGVIPPGTVSHESVSSIDYFPTVAEAVGVDLPKGREIDGVSLLDHVRSGGNEPIGRTALYWHFPHYRQGHRIPPYSIVRDRDWKMIYWWERPNEPELYDLDNDLGETRNVTRDEPARVEALRRMLMEHLEAVGARVPRPNPDYEG